MTTTVVPYLTRAMDAIRSLGIPIETKPLPVIGVLEKIKGYDEQRVLQIANTLQQSAAFSDAVRNQISGFSIADRYTDIAASFNSIRTDAQEMAKWMEDGELDFRERVMYHWMKFRRGSVPDRFEAIRNTYLQVSKDAKDQIDREVKILKAYQDYRFALQQAEVEAQEVLKVATAKLQAEKDNLTAANAAVDGYTGEDAAERTRLEMKRDEAIRALQEEDERFQVSKDMADELKTAYNTAELVFARIQQTSQVKERVFQRSVTFFSTNEIVFTGLAAAFTQSAGLNEATNALEAMKDGMNKGFEAMGSSNNAALNRALTSGYGKSLDAKSVANLANSIVDFQESSMKLIADLRKQSSDEALAIEDAANDSKRRFAQLVSKPA